MAGLLPAAVYGLEVPCGDLMIPAALAGFPASFRITMAAIDPTAAPEFSGTASEHMPPRATLKLIRQPLGSDDSTDSDVDSEEEDYLNKILNGAGSDEDDEESSDDQEEKNGGPSDPAKSKKARKEAAVEQLKKAFAATENDSEHDDMDVDGAGAINGIVSKLKKGKAKATGDEDEDGGEDDEDSEDLEVEEFVLCTLDPEKNYQQPLDITIGEDESVLFKVSGTHAVYLTGNYVFPAEDSHNHRHEIYDSEDDDEDYDLSPDEDELDEEESDELDGLEDPRIMEVNSEDDAEPPKLVKAVKEVKKGKNKRVAVDSDEPAGLDDIMAKSLKPEEPATNGEPRLSKKQMKKLKNNAGVAVAATTEDKSVKKVDSKPSVSSESPGPKDKKVKFAKNLEQGPSGTAAETKAQTSSDKKADASKETEKPKPGLGVKTIQGVKIDDKKLGTGPVAKKGDKVGMRYIGKLQDGKVFDANKKGKPFAFKLGAGEVIKGWDIGIAGMSIGGERRITIPASLGYGSKEVPGIPRNSQLIFDVKLLEIK